MQEEFHFMQDKKRLKEIKIFLQNRCNLKKYNMEKLSLDGSSRQYYRIYLPNEDSKILLDDKNLENNSKEFALLSSFLRKNNVIAPKVFFKNLSKGLMLIEDFGNTDFIQKSTGNNDKILLQKAVDILIKLHKVQELPSFIKPMDEKIIMDNFALFTDWYIPACLKQQLPFEKRKQFFDIIKNLISSIKKLPETLVLWDYHVNNVMFPEKYDDAAVIDFQSAMRGNGLYDLVSLLEDERKDISQTLSNELKEYYFCQSNFSDKDLFDKSYAFMALLRHMRVLGRFTTLITINKKPIYKKYVPHGLELLQRSLQNPLFKDISQWMNENFPLSKWEIPEDKQISKAFILAAGRGTRMLHLTQRRSKPMVKVANRHLIDYSFDLLKNAKIQDIVTNVCWQKGNLKKHLKTLNNFNIIISEEKTALETGGGIKKALNHFNKKPFIIINSDNILIDNTFKPILRQMMDNWDEQKYDILLLLTHINNTYGGRPEQGNYKIDGNLITRNKFKVCNGGFDYVYVGIAIIHPRIFQCSPRGKFSIRDLFDKAEQSDRLGYMLSDCQEFLVDSPEAVVETEKILLLQK